MNGGIERMDIQVHGPSVGQDRYNTFFRVSVPKDVSYSAAQVALSDYFYKIGYYGARIEEVYPSDDRHHYKVAAYKD